MKIFTEQEIRTHVQLNAEAISKVEAAFSDFAVKKVVMPPIMRIDVEENNGEVDVKSAYIPNEDYFALKVSSGFFDNPKLGLPSANGLMMLISTVTGEPKALLLDNGYLTEVRTAAAGAIAAKHLAKAELSTAGVIGTGAQARYQMKALKLVRDFEEILVYGRSQQKLEQFKTEMEEMLGVTVTIASSAEQVVRNSDIVVTTTPAKEPVIKAEWLHPGLHITAMGSDAEEKQELEAAVLAKADKYVADSKLQCARLGELHHAIEQGLISAEQPVKELGEIIAGKTAGRQNDEEITVCDLTGMGIQDTAIALYAFSFLNKSAETGIVIDNKKNTQIGGREQEKANV